MKRKMSSVTELLDTIVSEGRKEEIMNLLDDVFRNRFHMNVDIRVTYKENEWVREAENMTSRGFSRKLMQSLNDARNREANMRSESLLWRQRRSHPNQEARLPEKESRDFRKIFFRKCIRFGRKERVQKEGIPQEGLCASGEDRRRSEPDLRKEF